MMNMMRIKENGKMFNEENISFNGSDSCETGVSLRYSRESKNSNNSFNVYGFLGTKNKPDLRKVYKNEIQEDSLLIDLKYILSKLSASNVVNNQFYTDKYHYEYYLNNSKNTCFNDNIAIKSNCNSVQYNTYYKNIFDSNNTKI